MKWEKASKAQQSYARQLRDKTGVNPSQVMKSLDDFAAYDRGEITAAQLTERTGHEVNTK